MKTQGLFTQKDQKDQKDQEAYRKQAITSIGTHYGRFIENQHILSGTSQTILRTMYPLSNIAAIEVVDPDLQKAQKLHGELLAAISTSSSSFGVR